MLDPVMLHRADVEILQDMEQLQQQHAARGRRAGGDGMAAVLAPNRRHDGEFVGREISFGDQAAGVAKSRRHLGREFAVVEQVRPALG